jgi:hypothetical protein
LAGLQNADPLLVLERLDDSYLLWVERGEAIGTTVLVDDAEQGNEPKGLVELSLEREGSVLLFGKWIP